MGNQLVMLMLFLLLAFPVAVQAEDQPKTDTAKQDEKVIAVLEILELMEMVDDLPMLKDMEYLMEVDPNEPQK